MFVIVKIKAEKGRDKIDENKSLKWNGGEKESVDEKDQCEKNACDSKKKKKQGKEETKEIEQE